MSRLKIALVVVLMVSAAASAQIPFIGVVQKQHTIGRIENLVDINHGSQGDNLVSLKIDNVQNADHVQGLVADQVQNGFLMQVGNMNSESAAVAINQNIGSTGKQDQTIGAGFARKNQSQDSLLLGNQDVGKNGGTGGGNAFMVGNVSTSQRGQNEAGTVEQRSNVSSVQNSTYDGAAGTRGTVSSTVYAKTVQEQFAQ